MKDIDRINKLLEEMMEVICGERGPRLTLEYAEDARYVYPERLNLLAQKIQEIRSHIDYGEV